MSTTPSPLASIPPARRHRLCLAGLLIAYLGQMVIFARFYELKHKQDPTAFLFNETITKKQSSIDRDELDRTLSDARIHSRAMAVALTFASIIRRGFDSHAHRIPLKDTVVLDFAKDNIEMHIAFTLGGLKEEGRLSIRDQKHPTWAGFNVSRRFNAPEKFYEGNGFETSPEASAQVVEEFESLIKEAIERLLGTIARLESEIAALEANGPQWHFTEYLYFSVIVLGGGSGDVIPNSRDVRALVIIQYLIAVTILCFLINGLTSSVGSGASSRP